MAFTVPGRMQAGFRLTGFSETGCFMLASLLENQGVDDEEASAEEVIGVCWFCGAKLKDGYDRDVVCRECLGEEEE